MLLKMTVGLSGPAINLVPGDVWDFPQDEALRLVAAGYAVPASEEPIERAVEEPAPTVERRGRGRPKK